MALTSLTKDFITRSGLAVEGQSPVSTSTYTVGFNTGTLQVAGGAAIGKNIIVGSTATIYGITYLNNQLVVNSSATIATTLSVTGATTLAGATVTGNLVANSGAVATGPANNSGALQVTGGAGISGNLYVGGTTYLVGDLYVDGTQFVVNSETLNAGEKTLVLSTGSTSAVVATDAGLYIGASSSTAYISLKYDGVNSWVIPNSATSGGLKVKGLTGTVSTDTGALQVAGGVGIAGGLVVGSVITATSINATLGNASTPGNIYGGAAGSLVYQSAQSTTDFLPIGSNANVLQVIGGVLTWSPLSGISAGQASTATNIAGGDVGQIPYQSAPGNTVFSGALTFNGTTFTSTNVSVAGTTNSTSPTIGALTVAGGVGITKDVYIGGAIYIGSGQLGGNTATFQTVAVTGTGVVLTIPNGSVSIGQNLTVGSQANFNGGLTATGITATSLTVTGNQNISGSLVVTNNLQAAIVTATTVNVTGNETVAGSLTVTSLSALNGGATTTVLTATNGLYASGQFNGGYADGIVVDYATGNGRISVGNDDRITLYSGGVAGTAILTVSTQTTTVTNALAVGTNASVAGSVVVTGNLQAAIVTATTVNVTGNETISGSLAVTGNITATNITATSITVNALTNNGNFNVSGSIVATGNIQGGIFTATASNITGNETVGGSLAVTGNISANVITATTLVLTGNTTEQGVFAITNVTGTISTNTGALQVVGGVGVGGGVYVGGTVTATNIIATNATIQNLTLGAPLSFTNITTTNIVVQGEATFLNVTVTGTNTVSGPSTFSNTVNVTSPTNATNTTTGALKVVGGVGVGRDVQVGGTIYAGVNSSGTTATTVVGLQSNAFQASSYISGTLGSGQTGVEQYLDAFSTATFRSAEYTVQITDFPKIHMEKILLIHDGTNNIYMTEFGVITNQGNLGTFDAAFTGTNVVLKFTPTAPTAMNIKLLRTAIII